MKITPSARILRMLGEIEFAEWQCIAELVDNSFDDFNGILDDGVPWAGGFTVSVSLPRVGTRLVDCAVSVIDTGRGMSRERLEHAVKAGWSSNDQFDKLGLFGMGFNVSTARLGRRTRVLTTRAGDTEWIGVDIDLDAIGDDFEAPDITEEKVDPSVHGTRIEISRLDPDRADWLQRNATALRKQLGHVYGWLLTNRPFDLRVGGVRVKPYRLCRWGDDRSVTYGAGKRAEVIPAYMPIDQTYAPAETCLDCGNWQEPGLEECQQCGGRELRARERRMHGWLGVQRYLDRTEFGVDFLRNGRKILMHDKRIFEWSDPNDPTAAVLVEYPVELGQGGRIIGEIHLDHVPVNYQKNAFEFSDKQWKQALVYLRGAGPLLPQKAKELHFPDNDSFVGRLVKGYRRTDPGRRYLVPGNGDGPLHEKAREWARRFHHGDPEFETDQVWWDAVVQHERLKAAKETKTADVAAGAADDDAVRLALPPSQPAVRAPASIPEPPPAPVETAYERFERYARDGLRLADLCGDFGHPEFGFVKLTSYAVDAEVLDANGISTPATLVPGTGGSAAVYINRAHELFAVYGWDFADALLVELSMYLRALKDRDTPLSEVIARIQHTTLKDRAIDLLTVAAQAHELVGEIRQRIAVAIEDAPERAYQHLTADEAASTENAMIADGARGSGPLGNDPRFVLYAPELFLVRLVEEWPEAFFDGRVFAGPYDGIDAAAGRRLAVTRVTSLFADLAALLLQKDPGPRRLRRAQLSISLLAEELAEA